MESVEEFNKELLSISTIKPPISKAKITSITKLALKATHYYKYVVQSVEKFIWKCKSAYKLPGLYVIDAIIHQARLQFKYKDVYAPRFARNLYRTFAYVFQCPDEDRKKVLRVLNLWSLNDIFKEDVLKPIFELAEKIEKKKQEEEEEEEQQEDEEERGGENEEEEMGGEVDDAIVRRRQRPSASKDTANSLTTSSSTSDLLTQLSHLQNSLENNRNLSDLLVSLKPDSNSTGSGKGEAGGGTDTGGAGTDSGLDGTRGLGSAASASLTKGIEFLLTNPTLIKQLSELQSKFSLTDIKSLEQVVENSIGKKATPGNVKGSGGGTGEEDERRVVDNGKEGRRSTRWQQRRDSHGGSDIVLDGDDGDDDVQIVENTGQNQKTNKSASLLAEENEFEKFLKENERKASANSVSGSVMNNNVDLRSIHLPSSDSLNSVVTNVNHLRNMNEKSGEIVVPDRGSTTFHHQPPLPTTSSHLLSHQFNLDDISLPSNLNEIHLPGTGAAPPPPLPDASGPPPPPGPLSMSGVPLPPLPPPPSTGGGGVDLTADLPMNLPRLSAGGLQTAPAPPPPIHFNIQSHLSMVRARTNPLSEFPNFSVPPPIAKQPLPPPSSSASHWMSEPPPPLPPPLPPSVDATSMDMDISQDGGVSRDEDSTRHRSKLSKSRSRSQTPRRGRRSSSRRKSSRNRSRSRTSRSRSRDRGRSRDGRKRRGGRDRSYSRDRRRGSRERRRRSRSRSGNRYRSDRKRSRSRGDRDRKRRDRYRGGDHRRSESPVSIGGQRTSAFDRDLLAKRDSLGRGDRRSSPSSLDDSRRLRDGTSVRSSREEQSRSPRRRTTSGGDDQHMETEGEDRCPPIDDEKDAERRAKGYPPPRKDHITICTKTLWVGHLPKTITESELRSMFTEFGPINTINLIPPRGCAFVNMVERVNAVDALKGLKSTKLGGKYVAVDWAPGKYCKDGEYKKFWDVSVGATFLPYNEIENTNFESLIEGCVFDFETVPEFLRSRLEMVQMSYEAQHCLSHPQQQQMGVHHPLPLMLQPPPQMMNMMGSFPMPPNGPPGFYGGPPPPGSTINGPPPLLPGCFPPFPPMMPPLGIRLPPPPAAASSGSGGPPSRMNGPSPPSLVNVPPPSMTGGPPLGGPPVISAGGAPPNSFSMPSNGGAPPSTTNGSNNSGFVSPVRSPPNKSESMVVSEEEEAATKASSGCNTSGPATSGGLYDEEEGLDVNTSEFAVTKEESFKDRKKGDGGEEAEEGEIGGSDAE